MIEGRYSTDGATDGIPKNMQMDGVACVSCPPDWRYPEDVDSLLASVQREGEAQLLEYFDFEGGLPWPYERQHAEFWVKRSVASQDVLVEKTKTPLVVEPPPRDTILDLTFPIRDARRNVVGQVAAERRKGNGKGNDGDGILWLSYWLASAHRNKSVTTKAVRTVLRFLFQFLSYARVAGINNMLPEVRARCFRTNVASARVLAKCGFEPVTSSCASSLELRHRRHAWNYTAAGRAAWAARGVCVPDDPHSLELSTFEAVEEFRIGNYFSE